MQAFETKRALLIYAWKNPDDRKLVDRWIAKGIVWMDDWMYCTELWQVRVWDEVEVSSNEETKRLEEELYEAKKQWKYYEDVCESRRKLMEAIIHETYVITKAKLWNKMEDESDFRLAILERARESLRNK